MNAIVLQSHNHKSLSPSSFNKQIRLRNPICTFNDGRTALTLRKNVLRLGVSSTNSDAGRPLQPERTEMENESKISEFPDENLNSLAKREKMIALLRRIQSSISKAEATRAKQNRPILSDQSPAELAQKVRPPSQKPAKGNVSRGRKGHQVSASKRSVPRKNDRNQKKPQQSEARFNVTRLPSNFMKKSPVPTLLNPRGKPIDEHNDFSAVTRPPTSFRKKSPIPTLSSPRGIPMVENDDFSETTVQGEVPTKDLKMPELKELAKSRGIKGYSKLKKKELLELLSAPKKNFWNC